MLRFSLKPYICKLHVVSWQTTSNSSTKVRAARAVRRIVFPRLIIQSDNSYLVLPLTLVRFPIDRFLQQSIEHIACCAFS